MEYKVYIGLGSNIGNRIQYLEGALSALQNNGIITILKKSSYYRTQPIESSGQFYLNCAIEATTNLTPNELLLETGKIENIFGRKRYFHNNPRTIDIDILLYEDFIIQEPELQIPHPRLQKRSFVIRPLLEINADIFIPGIGKLINIEDPGQYCEKIIPRKLIWKGKYSIMGILNITPDSFFDGGKHFSLNGAISQFKKLIDEGADIIDIGGQSTRPGHTVLDPDGELQRLEPIISEIRKYYPDTPISMDTYYPIVIQKLQKYGIDIINDVSDNIDGNKGMLEIAQEIGATYIATSHASNIETMVHSFSRKKEIFDELGFHDYIFDPGFGFGKTLDENYAILSEISALHQFNVPILVGISRKSMVYNTLKISPQDALNGTTALNTIALLNGAHIIRTHDVKEALEVLNLYYKYEFNNTRI